MSLRAKTLILTVLIVALTLAAMTIGARRLVLGNFDDIEREAVLDRAKQAHSIVTTMADEFQLRGLDWSDWDDMATYLEDHNAGFEEANLTADGLASCNWDHLIVIRKDGARVFSAQLDRDGAKLVPAASDVDALIDRGTLQPEGEAIVAGFAEIDGHIHLVASRPIKRTDHQPGAMAGRMVTTRLVDPAWMARLRKFTFLDVAFLPTNGPADAEASAARAALDSGLAAISFERPGSDHAAYARLEDVEGHPLFDLRIVEPRALSDAATKMASTLADYGVIGGLFLALLAVLLVGRGVLTPLSRVLAGVRRVEAGDRAQVEVGSSDEIGQLARAFNGMVKVIGEREDELRLVLDSTGEGLAIIDFTGKVEGQVSAPAKAWFGAPEGRLIWDWLPVKPEARSVMVLGLEQIADGFLPFELAASQMPDEITVGASTYRLEYKGVSVEGRLSRLLLVIRDATGEVAVERLEQEGLEIQAIARMSLRDRNALPSFLEESDRLAESLTVAIDLVEIKRILHTLKGNCSVFGLESVAKAAHRAEDRIHEGERYDAVRGEALDAWYAARARVFEVFDVKGAPHVELGESEYTHFLETLATKSVDADVLDMVRGWRNLPTRVVLERCAKQIEGVARRCGKEVSVKISDPGGRLPRSDLGPFFASTVHLIRNGIDHGIEPKNERLAHNKAPVGTIELAVHRLPDAVIFEVRDDGRGIDWEAVRAKAKGLGLPAESQADLEGALFDDGVTTKIEASELSGRGVGLNAVRQACLAAGGQVSIQSELGRGTSFCFRFPSSPPRRDRRRTRDLPELDVSIAVLSSAAIS